jgi:hypothetical protein
MDYKTVVIAFMAVIVVLLAGVNAIFLMSPETSNNTTQLSLPNNTTSNITYSSNNSYGSIDEEPSHKVAKTNLTKKNNTVKNNTGNTNNTNNNKDGDDGSDESSGKI